MINEQIKISSDCNNKFYTLTICDLVLFISYETIVAFKYKGKMFISENKWSMTTGKHLNTLDDDKSIRIPHDEMMRKLNGLKIVILPNI
jgi:hypothetical protein